MTRSTLYSPTLSSTMSRSYSPSFHGTTYSESYTHGQTGSTYSDSYRSPRGQTGIGSTYTDSYHSPYGQTSTGSTYSGNYSPARVHTGAMEGSYSTASSRFQPTSSKPPPYKRPSGTGLHTSTRPLPNGPGPRDHTGTRITPGEARHNFRPSSSHTRSPSRCNPVKADHSCNYYNGYGAKTSSVETSRLSRHKRTNSISDLTTGIDNVSLNRSSLVNSRKFGSTADINGNMDNCSEFLDDLYPNKSPVTHQSTALPNINDRPNSPMSRSPSVDRRFRNNSLNNNVASTVSEICFFTVNHLMLLNYLYM